jgi:hypothetical protein
MGWNQIDRRWESCQDKVLGSSMCSKTQFMAASTSLLFTAMAALLHAFSLKPAPHSQNRSKEVKRVHDRPIAMSCCTIASSASTVEEDRAAVPSE